MACVDAAPWCAYAAARFLAFLYVAASFSMESAEQDAAIWALSTEFTMGHTSNLLIYYGLGNYADRRLVLNPFCGLTQ